MPTSPTAVSAAPTTPDRADRATFPTRMYNFFVYIKDTFIAAINALATNVYNNAVEAAASATTANTKAGEAAASASTATTQAGIATTQAAAASASAASAAAIAGAFVGTSTSSLAIATGSKSFTTQAGEQYSAGIWMTAVSQADPANWMFGQVTSYSGTTLVLDVQATGGSGTHADWNLSLTGARGAQGKPGTLAGNATGNISMAGYALDESRGSVAMHATTMDLWAQPNIIDGTGSAVTVTAIANAPQAGARRVLYPVAGSVITNGATFAVDGAANHTAAAGDKWEFEALTTSTYKVHVTKKDGTAVVAAAGGAWVFLSAVTASNSATVDIETTFDSTYDMYAIVASGITVQTSGILQAQLKVGGSYMTLASYSYHTTNTTSGSTAYAAVASDAEQFLKVLTQLDSTASSSAGLVMYVPKPASTTLLKHVFWHGGVRRAQASSNAQNCVGAGGYGDSQTGALTGVRFAMAAGNIVAGTFRLYGIKNS